MNINFLNLHEVILIVSMLEAIFLCIFFFLMPGKQQFARRILAFLFLLVAGKVASTLVIWNGYLQTQEIARWSIAPTIVSVCILLEGPTLYFYLCSLSRKTRLWQWANVLHLIPALTCVAIILFFNITVDEWLPRHWSALPVSTLIAIKIVWALFKYLPLGYAFFCFYAEYRLRQDMKQVYSNISRVELIATDIILCGFFLRWLWSCLGYLMGDYISIEANNLVGALSDYLTAILLNALFIFGLMNTRKLLTITPVNSEVEPAEVELPKEKIEAIERGIYTQKLHLDSEINLKGFAEQIGLKPRDLSTIINSHYKSNFFEFINGHRIEEAKRLLATEDSTETILDVVYKAGFNSPSAFHRFFKRIEGVTPSEYRKREKNILK